MAAPYQAYGAGVPQSAYGGQGYPGQNYPYRQQAPGQQYPGQAGSPYGQPGAHPYRQAEIQASYSAGQPQYSMAQQYAGVGGQGYPQGYPGFGMDPQVQQWFLSVDRDRSGKITAVELEQAMKNSPQQFSLKTCQLMIGMFDRDGSGTIDMSEFQTLWGFIQQWRAAFDHYDKSRSGLLEQDELTQVFSELGFRLSANLLNSLISKFDKTKRGLNLDQFLTSCVMIRSLSEIFRQRDTNQSGTIQLNYEEFLGLLFNFKI